MMQRSLEPQGKFSAELMPNKANSAKPMRHTRNFERSICSKDLGYGEVKNVMPPWDCDQGTTSHPRPPSDCYKLFMSTDKMFILHFKHVKFVKVFCFIICQVCKKEYFIKGMNTLAEMRIITSTLTEQSGWQNLLIV